MGNTIAGPMSSMQDDMMRRQIELNASQVRERQMAMGVARQREMFTWMATFASIAIPALLLKARTSPAAAAPVLPISFIVAYNYDMAYGNKMERIRADAEQILNDKALHDRYLPLPNGEPTLEAIVESLKRKGRI